MIYRFIILLTIFIIIAGAKEQFAQPLNGSYNCGSGQTFTSLTANTSAGFFHEVNSRGLSGNVTLYITSGITENGAVSLNQWAGNYTITIRPSNTALKTISGSVTTAMINLDGADNLTIDGRYNGSGRYLRFANTSTGGSTFRFINDASNNTITYCRVDGMRVNANSGIIDFATTTGTTGNDNNTISYCTMQDYSGGTLQNAIVSYGTTSTSARYNSGISILNNEIIDVYRSGELCTAIKLMNGSTDFTITGNSIYQTATRNPASATYWYLIYVNTSVANNITVSNNYLGGTAPNCGGTPWTVTGNRSNVLYFMRFQSAGTSTASNIDGNYMQNLDFTSRPSSSAVGYFAGIIIESGLVNVGSNAGNTIGSSTGTGNISLSYDGTATNIINRGIHNGSRGDIKNNTIGSISIGGSNTEMIRLECIYYTGSPSTGVFISNNTVGSTSTPNSIQQTSNTFDFQLTGIHSQISGSLMTISGNTVSNLVVTENSTTSRIRGIYQARSTTASLSVTNNVISNLYCASTQNDRYPDNTSLIGLFTGSSSVSQTFTGNTISGLYGTSNSDSYVVGFGFYSNVAKGTFENNRIYNLNHSSTTGTAKIWGINAFWGSWNFYNNQITITNGELTDNIHNISNNNPSKTEYKSVSRNTEFSQSTDNINELNSLSFKDTPLNKTAVDKGSNNSYTDASTNGVEIKGIHDEAEFPCLYYYNSVYVGGSASSGSANSFAYDRPLLSWATNASLRNNLFFNGRTGGSGGHYAIGNEVGILNWTNTSADYNVYVSSSSSRIAIWGSSDQTIYQWRDSSLGDKHTWSTTSSDIAPDNLFNSISSGNLNIKTGNWEAWIVSGKGMQIAGNNTDYNGNTRATTVSGGCTDIGSHEFSATPPSNPIASADNPPGIGVTSNYTLWGRVIAVINWGSSGSFPTGMNVRYYSGVNPPDVLGGGYSNSYWSFIPVGSLTNATYNISINFSQYETYSITSPSANTRLAKYVSTWEVFSTAGTGSWQTELNWGSEFAKTRDMNSFSVYALTDATAPLPVELCSFNAAVFNRDARLTWTTCSEVNNKGFEVERRNFNSVTSNYNTWKKIAFIQGNGTTTEEHNYNYNDNKLNSGKYQYRLKQIDYNGNYEYFNLTSPNDVIVGTPLNADLFQNYPNPSNPSSKVDFQIPFSSKVTLKVYDITGKEAAILVDKEMDGGFYTAEFNGSNLSSGVYFYRIIAKSSDGNTFTKTMKLILIK
ncbi:MAG: T9SS type A sorting domain-containing protein [Ignavibacteria bacterium]|nr:T9SS type A sorting domain-containing protein [Ignavibacteria bacterium]